MATAYTAVKKFCRKVQPPEQGAPTLQTDVRRNYDSKDPNVTQSRSGKNEDEIDESHKSQLRFEYDVYLLNYTMGI